MNADFKSVINLIYNDNLIHNLNYDSRVVLGKSIQILKKSPLHIKDIEERITKIENLIQDYDKNIFNNLNTIIKLKCSDIFIVYFDQNIGYKIEILDRNNSLFNRIKFYVKKFLYNDSGLLIDVLQSAHLNANREEFKNKIIDCSDNLRKIRNLSMDYYSSKSSIQQHAKLTKEINKILDLIITPENEQSILLDKIRRGREFLENLTSKDRFENLCGMTIASTVSASNRESIIEQGGYGIFSTEKEGEILQALLSEPDSSSPLSLPEKNKVQHYLEDIERSRDLNLMLASLISKQNPLGVCIAAKKTFNQIFSLEEGESILMDVGYLGHSMRAQFLKNENRIEINLFDTSGALDLWISKNPFPFIFNQLMGIRENIALSTSVDLEEFKQRGRAYLEQIITMESKGVEDRLRGRNFLLRYADFMRVFRSINPQGSLQTRQLVQKAQNCFAQRIRACEAHCLGASIYQKIRVYSLKKMYNELWKLASKGLQKKEILELSKRLGEKRLLNKKELKEVRNQLNLLEKYPTTADQWYPIFALINHDILKQRKSH